ncbi:hypothetical protein CRX72_17260 [Pantoea sp. BRM17]|nr:hypothetical protein CRX72_17260 [Pantoea sp. BRM17]
MAMMRWWRGGDAAASRLNPNMAASPRSLWQWRDALVQSPSLSAVSSCVSISVSESANSSSSSCSSVASSPSCCASAAALPAGPGRGSGQADYQ